MNLYLHRQAPNRWHDYERFYLDDFEVGSPRDSCSAMYLRADMMLYEDSPTFFRTVQDAINAVKGSEYRIINLDAFSAPVGIANGNAAKGAE